MTHLDPKALEAASRELRGVRAVSGALQLAERAISAYLAALPQAEPVGWRWNVNRREDGEWITVYDKATAGRAMSLFASKGQPQRVTPLFASPTPAVSREVTEEMLDRALTYWCSKLPKARREQPIPDKLREHMRSTLSAALSKPHSEK